MKPIINIYAEATPNPESIKFVFNVNVSGDRSEDYTNAQEAMKSPLAGGLFKFNFVRGVYISQNFITITKDPESLWVELIPILRAYLKEYAEQGNPVFYDEDHDLNSSVEIKEGDSEPVRKIKQILAQSIKPAVEMDGGNIEFRSFEDGVVTVSLKGSCSGCPSSTITLKAGIENLLKRMVPEVKEVIAEAA
jgi:Fe-S cluster biogenesis protein NfuA